MIAAARAHVLTADVAMAGEGVRAKFFAVCGASGCSNLAGSGFARKCLRTNCGLDDRFNHAGRVNP